MNINGYETITGLYGDFTGMEQAGISALNDTINTAFNRWKNNYRYLAELAIVLDYNTLEHKDKNKELAEVYGTMLLEVENHAINNLKGAQKNYYMRTTDYDMKWSNYYLRICEEMEKVKN